MKRLLVLLILLSIVGCATITPNINAHPSLNRYRIELGDGTYRELNGYCCQVEGDTLYIVNENGQIIIDKGWKSYEEIKGKSSSKIVYEKEMK